MVAKVSDTDWQPQNGVAIMKGIDDATGKMIEIAIPLAAFPKLCADARRFLSGIQAQANKKLSYGQMHYVEHCTAMTYNLGILPTPQGEKISLVMDRNLETQIGFSIEIDHARAIGNELIETANRASKIKPAKN
jgi:hypothetical protein